MLGSAETAVSNVKRIPVSVRILTELCTTTYISKSPEIITNNKPTRRMLPGCETTEHELGYALPSHAEVKNIRSCNFTLPSRRGAQ